MGGLRSWLSDEVAAARRRLLTPQDRTARWPAEAGVSTPVWALGQPLGWSPLRSWRTDRVGVVVDRLLGDWVGWLGGVAGVRLLVDATAELAEFLDGHVGGGRSIRSRSEAEHRYRAKLARYRSI